MAEINPQFSTVRVLRPASGFEAVYQGLSAGFPIAFPGGLDLEAGRPHYSATLLDMSVVPMGARVLLWIPMCFKSDPESATPVRTYQYQILWRLRNLQEQNDSVNAGLPPTKQKQYAIENRSLGAPDINGDQQVVVPCAMETIAYEQTEPGGDFANGRVNLRGNLIVPDGAAQTSAVFPQLPGGLVGTLGQGTFNFQLLPGSISVPTYMVYETVAAGNEMGILATRTSVSPGDKWDFTSNTNDRTFSNTYGTDNGNRPETPNLGIFLMTGSP